MPARPHGVRKQDWDAQQAFRLEAQHYNEQRRAAVQTSAAPPRIVEVRQMCWCSARPIPHLHGEMELRAFEAKRPGAPWERNSV